MTLTACIFSFNRGRYLKNCVESVQNCIPDAEIVIFDDASSDTDTQAYLKQISERHQILTPTKAGTNKHGGLYHNMNAALDVLRDRELLCFLQDDTQIVRKVSCQEIQEIRDLFSSHASLGFLHPCFIRGISHKKHPVTPMTGPTQEVFFRQDRGQSAGVFYSDLVIFRPQRLISIKWHFQQSEPSNDNQARAHFDMMAYMWFPFAMWLPEVPAYRGKKKTFALRMAENKKRVGFYPFNILSDQDAEKLKYHKEERLPIAEDYLECTPVSPPPPWTYNPLTGLRLLKHLNTAELAFRRWFNI